MPRKFEEEIKLKKAEFKPIVLEVSGLPNSGKDTQIGILSEYFSDALGFRVRQLDTNIVQSTIMKESFYVNRFFDSLLKSASQLQEAVFSNPGGFDIILLNRGIFDRIVFLHFFAERSQINLTTAKKIESFLVLFSRLIDFVIMLDISTKESLKRQQIELTRKVAFQMSLEKNKEIKEQSIHQDSNLIHLSKLYDDLRNKHKKKFKFIQVDGEKSPFDVARNLNLLLEPTIIEYQKHLEKSQQPSLPFKQSKFKRIEKAQSTEDNQKVKDYRKTFTG